MDDTKCNRLRVTVKVEELLADGSPGRLLDFEEDVPTAEIEQLFFRHGRMIRTIYGKGGPHVLIVDPAMGVTAWAMLITAIKGLRKFSGCSLKDAKNAVYNSTNGVLFVCPDSEIARLMAEVFEEFVRAGVVIRIVARNLVDPEHLVNVPVYRLE